MNSVLKFLCVILCTIQLVFSQWDFAITTKNRITFYNENWSIFTTAAHQFDELSAVTFDESDERIYFTDLAHQNGSIFSLKISANENNNHLTQMLLTKTQNETIVGIVFDPIDRMLYWTDTTNKRIYQLEVDNKNSTPKVLFDFGKEDVIPSGIAVDICRRKLYWTNSNHKKASIERSSLNGSKREVIVDSDLFLPHGIAVDQFSRRIYWVVDQQGRHFSVESANLDGTDRQIIVQGLNNVPFSIAVTNKAIYWTDLTHNAIWNVSKVASNTERPSKVQNFPTQPRGIVTRLHLLSRLENDLDCKDKIKTIKMNLLKSNNIKDIETENYKIEKKICLNKGEYSSSNDLCFCKAGFTGSRCEVEACHNYCVHGTCNLSSTGIEECTCQEGFFGERCEFHKCSNFCLHGGRCEIFDGTPRCQCPEMHTGLRCELNTTDNCFLHCKLRSFDPEIHLPFHCYDICENYFDETKESSVLKSTGTIAACNSTYNKTVIFVVIGILTALALVVLIIHALRRIYKPARPRIKKTFVVQKKISQTPLTSRPLATEQCEITIENCCNMNICDTPCFDPKLLQQNMTFDTNMKEDKKILINNMEEDLY